MAALDPFQQVDRPRTYAGAISLEQLEQDAVRLYPQSFALLKSEIKHQGAKKYNWHRAQLSDDEAAEHHPGPAEFHIIDTWGDVNLSFLQYEDDGCFSYTKKLPDFLRNKDLRLHKIWHVIVQKDLDNRNHILMEAAIGHLYLEHGLLDEYWCGNDFKDLCTYVNGNLRHIVVPKRVDKNLRHGGRRSEMATASVPSRRARETFELDEPSRTPPNQPRPQKRACTTHTLDNERFQAIRAIAQEREQENQQLTEQVRDLERQVVNLQEMKDDLEEELFDRRIEVFMNNL